MSGAILPNDTICTQNHYCPEESTTPTACPPGSFSDKEGNIAVDNCDTCTPGYYCASFGISGPCAPGYYCPAGQSSATPANYTCPEGHYCPGERGLPDQCPAGSYQDETGQVTCKDCPFGRYVKHISTSCIYELRREKTGFLHMRKQRRRSASR